MSDLDDLSTEKPNPRSVGLDLLAAADILRIINDEDRLVAAAVDKEIPRIAEAVERAAAAIRAGGRLHLFGAGTSGRLAVLDASEMHPTFGVPLDLVQGHIAGGDAALRRPVEGAEDDEDDGARRVDAAQVGTDDVAMALSASGRAPWCVGVLRRAKELGAFTIAITCNERTAISRVADLTIQPLVGREVITGSTRMKAGTAQKLVLNMISTGAMVRAGLTYGNLMVGLTPTNTKLKERARGLVRSISGYDEVDDALKSCDWNVRAACIVLMKRMSAADARAHLEACDGSLRRALG
ncbi:MAG: N-acetylmuramic acid 6-phosphate etherase [Planctomycetota bacterium]|nr:N-acetylmuramic acid 6-phosphate etherase [Planctomycetota bacterium]